jgi:hypothetical protein
MEVMNQYNLGFKKNVKGILRVLVKISFPPIFPILWGMKIWDLEGKGRNECSIPFPSLKLQTRKWYFHSFPFPP